MKKFLLLFSILFVCELSFSQSQIDNRLFGNWYLQTGPFILNLSIVPSGQFGNMTINGSYIKNNQVRNVNLYNAPVRNISNNDIVTPAVNINGAMGELKITYSFNGPNNLVINFVSANTPNPQAYSIIMNTLDLSGAFFMRAGSGFDNNQGFNNNNFGNGNNNFNNNQGNNNRPPQNDNQPSYKPYFGTYYAVSSPYFYNGNPNAPTTLSVVLDKTNASEFIKITGFINFGGRSERIDVSVKFNITPDGRITTRDFSFGNFSGNISIKFMQSGNSLVFGNVSVNGQNGYYANVLQSLTGTSFNKY